MTSDHSGSGEADNIPDFLSTANDDRTIISGSSPEDIQLTNAEIRSVLGIPDDDKMENYRDLHPLGLGGVGAVYAGHEPGTGREVAIKILRPQYRFNTQRISSFVREAQATAQIDHPNIVPVYRFGVFDNEGVYFSMKRVRGETLRSVLHQLEENAPGYNRKYTLRQLINIFLACCNAVAFANKNGILHGDLKPGNIMIGEFGEVMVMDWGMSRYRQELDVWQERNKAALETRHAFEMQSENADNPIGGTPAFMAPEHLTKDEKNLTERSEVYALGAILYCILTLKTAPFDTAQERDHIIMQVVRGRFTHPRKAAPAGRPVPRELAAICIKAMKKNPEKRYANVSALIEEIQNYLDGYPVRAYSPSPVYRLAKWITRHPLIPGVLLALGLGMGCFKSYTILQSNADIRSRLKLAEQHGLRAFDYASSVRMIYRQLQNDPVQEYAKRFELYRELNRKTALMANYNAMALSLLSRIPGDTHEKKSPRLSLAREILRNAVALYRELGDDQMLQETVEYYRKRWGSLFIKVLENDPELLRLITLTENHRGYLKIQLPEKRKWQIRMYDADGNKVDIADRSLDDLQLPAKDYVVTFSAAGTGDFAFPVRISPSKTVHLNPGFPEKIPDNMCFIGAGEIPVPDFIHAWNGKDIPAFMISKYEVTIGEYLEFWRTLDPVEKRRRTAVVTTFPDGTKVSMWDSAGKLIAPYSLKLPITGISAESARAYCRYLSRKTGMKVRLPRLGEWKKAYFRYPGDGSHHEVLLYSPELEKRYPAGAAPDDFPLDKSVFGVANMHGNVRELLFDTCGKANLVIGGSFLTPYEEALNQQEQFTISGDNDIGFRYVVELSDTGNKSKIKK